MSSAVGMALIDRLPRVRLAGRRAAARSRSPTRSPPCCASTAGRSRPARRVTSLAELPHADVVVLRPRARARSPRSPATGCPARVARAYRRYRHGPGAFKVDLAVEGGVPWANEACRRAGTVHAVGSFEEIVAAERDVNRGRMPERPFVLVAQQYLADPSRSAGDVHPVWAYAHVPNGYDGDATEAVIAQIERFAPGLRERIVATSIRSPAELAAYNANYVGGDIITGANTPVQIADPPAPRARPLRDRHPRRLHLLGRDPARAPASTG